MDPEDGNFYSSWFHGPEAVRVGDSGTTSFRLRRRPHKTCSQILSKA